MKFSPFLFIVLFPQFICAQFGTGGGTFTEYAASQVKTLTKLHISYNDTLPNDTTFKTKQYFNSKGQLIREEFQSIYNSTDYYEYSYNHRGFVIDIDSNGFFGYGYGGEDTTYHTKHSTYQSFHKTTRLVNEIITYIDEEDGRIETDYFYNAEGKIEKERTITSQKNPYWSSLNFIFYRYNDQGFLTETVYTDGEEKVHNKELIIYEVWD